MTTFATTAEPSIGTPARFGAHRLAPTRDDMVDGAAVMVLAVIALVGFANVFDGMHFLAVGLVGALGGGVVAYLAHRLRPNPVIAVLGFIAAFLLCGAIAVPNTAIAIVLPGPSTPLELFRGVIGGWKDLLTTAPPVSVSGHLGVVPYTCGFVAGGGGMLLARRTEWALVPVLPALLSLVASLALGTRDPVSLLVQGGLFTAVSIGWAAVRANRPRRMVNGEVYWPRVISGGAMLVTVAVLAMPLSSVLPGDDDDRYVAREEIVPPFDPRNEPSPLGAFRGYQGLGEEQELFAVSGLPKGSRLRLATMDTYDGVVWVVGGAQATGSGRFERVGDKIIPVPEGTSADVTVEVLTDRPDVWLPAAGWTSSVTFAGSARGDDLGTQFRYNRLTGTGAVPGRLVAGDIYTVHGSLTEHAEPALGGASELPDNLAIDSAVVLPEITGLPDAIREQATTMAGTATTPLGKAQALEAAFREGFYSDGKDASDSDAEPSQPGHSIFRINEFLDGPLVGNAEQYASAMALLARTLGLPARVVVGFDPAINDDYPYQEGEMTLVGGHAHAWVEIAFEDVGWVAFDPTPPKDRTRVLDETTQVQTEVVPPQELPDLEFLQLPIEVPEIAREDREEDEHELDSTSGFAIPAWLRTLLLVVLTPVVLAGSVLGLIVGFKALRARRRRTRGTPVERLSGAWREACDRARDRGVVIPRRVTRQEAARVIPATALPDAELLARDVDALMFGAPDPDSGAVDAIWAEIDRLRAAARQNLGLADRLKTAASLASFRRAG